MEITDPLPEFLKFENGSVEVNGRASNDYSYSASTWTLTLLADKVAPGETLTYTFRATIEDGAQGKFIRNTAVLKSPDREEQLPDTAVEVDPGKAMPSMTKTANVTEAKPGDIITYTITLKNGMDATADWKNVYVSDSLPVGLEFVPGSVTVDGQSSLYFISGRTISVDVGDIKPNQEVKVTLDARVLESAGGKTVYNTAEADSDNTPDIEVTDPTGVPVEKPTPEPDPDQPLLDENEKKIVASKTVDKTVVNVHDRVTYTISATNGTDKTWTDAQALDTLGDSLMTLIDDKVYIDGVICSFTSGKWSFSGRELLLNLGDIEPGRTVTAKFTVEFKNDAAGHYFKNWVSLKSSSHDTVTTSAPEVTINSSTGVKPISDNHYAFFAGTADGYGNVLNQWWPNTSMTVHQVCIVAYAILTDNSRENKAAGLPSYLPEIDSSNKYVIFAIKNKLLTTDEYNACKDRTYTDPNGITHGWACTQKLAYKILGTAISQDLSGYVGNANSDITRLKFAESIIDIQGRNINADHHGLPVKQWDDVTSGSYAAKVIDEVSNDHSYTKNSNNQESYWNYIISK